MWLTAAWIINAESAHIGFFHSQNVFNGSQRKTMETASAAEPVFSQIC